MCRLAFELRRCQQDLVNARLAVESINDSMGEENTSKVRVDGKWVPIDRHAALARHTDRRDQLEAICSGVSPKPGLEPWRLQRDAARAGHVPSMVRFAEGQPFSGFARLADLDALRAFRDEAPELLRRAVEMGEPRAAYLMMAAYRGNGMISATGRIPEDPGLALAYAIALQGVGDEASERSLDETINKLRRRLTTPQQRAAELAAQRLSLRIATAKGSSTPLRIGVQDSDGSECNEAAQPASPKAALQDEAPIAPEPD
jgi:hypothetical protein